MSSISAIEYGELVSKTHDINEKEEEIKIKEEDSTDSDNNVD